MDRPPIYRGWIRTSSGGIDSTHGKQQILEIGTGSKPRGSIDLGDVALLPGLVNAHTHLEFSDQSSPIGNPGISLSEWILEVIRRRGETTQESKAAAIKAGLIESVEAGVACLGEISTPPALLDILTSHYGERSQIDIVAFAETLGLDKARAAQRLQWAHDFVASSEHTAISPHAPYSTTWKTIEDCVALANQHQRPLAMHVAESPCERELLATGTGPMAESLRSLGVYRKELFPWMDTTFENLINLLAHAPQALLVHGNDFNSKEIASIANQANLSVVYCPRTHHFFRYDKHPVAEMLTAGIRVALGTDSRASNPDVDLWKEVQFLLKNRPDIPAATVIKMATQYGADALMRSDLGRIAVGCDVQHLGVVQTDAAKETTLCESFTERAFIRLDRYVNSLDK